MAKLQIPISKGVDTFIEVDTDELLDPEFPGGVFSDDVVKEILFQGLKQVLNRGMSKLASTKGLPEGKRAENNSALLNKATEQLEACRRGEIRVTGGKSKSKITGEVKNEAMRLARALVKQHLKAEGKVKVSHVPPKEITAAAKMVLEGEHGAALIEMARASVEARVKEEEKITKGIDLSMLKADPKLVAASEAKKASSKKAKAPPPAKARPEMRAH